MSGGHFDYMQYGIDRIVVLIEDYIRKCEKREERDWGYNDKDGRYIPCVYEESEEVLNEFRKAVNILNTAGIYAQRIDWYLSGDDGEESFFERLKEDLQSLEETKLYEKN